MAKDIAKSTAASVPAISENDDFEAYAGAGLENVGTDDILVPRLSILQSLSPQLNKKKTEYIEGAEIGSIADVGTGEIFPDGILFVPVYYRKDYLEWAPRSSGKGLVKVHPNADILQQCSRNDRNQPVLANGNYIAETAQWFGINLTADRRKCFIPMTSTQLKKSRKWMTLATSERLTRKDGSEFTAPLFYRAYKLTTGVESNSEGEWGGWVINRGPSIKELGQGWEAIRDEAIKFREALVAGSVRADVESDEHASSGEGAL